MKNLELLDVVHNCMTSAGVKALRATGVKLDARAQWDPENDEDEEYLFAGDIE